MSALETQALGLIPMVIEQSGRGERSYDIYVQYGVDVIERFEDVWVGDGDLTGPRTPPR